jgi:hypothetical protein
LIQQQSASLEKKLQTITFHNIRFQHFAWTSISNSIVVDGQILHKSRGNTVTNRWKSNFAQHIHASIAQHALAAIFTCSWSSGIDPTEYIEATHIYPRRLKMADVSFDIDRWIYKTRRPPLLHGEWYVPVFVGLDMKIGLARGVEIRRYIGTPGYAIVVWDGTGE